MHDTTKNDTQENNDDEKLTLEKTETTLVEELDEEKKETHPSEDSSCNNNGDDDGPTTTEQPLMEIEKSNEDEEMEDVEGKDTQMEGNAQLQKEQGGASTAAAASETETHTNTQSSHPSKTEQSFENVEGTKSSTDADPPVASELQQNGEMRKEENGAAASAGNSNGDAAAPPPPPVLKGTLSYSVELRRHLIRGMWNYENSNVFPPQRFELIRNLGPEEDLKVLPKDGEFHGSFSLAYFHTTSKGKQKERSRVIPENNVNIKFTKNLQKEGEFAVDGKGINQFGIFHINGTATPSNIPDDPTYHIVLRKRYEPSSTPTPTAQPPNQTVKTNNTGKSIANTTESENDGPLPPPSQSYPSGVVCLRGKLVKQEAFDLGITSVVQKISGLWATGLDHIEADPENSRGLLSKFEYEHKTSSTTLSFPVSGRYSGWFDIRSELDGSTNRVVEKDVTLKFKKNNAGFYNVEGRGTNAFGKYNITGTLSVDNVITIFRHFIPRKLKASNKGVTSAPGPINAPLARRTSISSIPSENRLKMEDVEVPPLSEGQTALDPFQLPANGTYSAVSRGVLRRNEDGSISCQGKWAVTREHFTNNQTSNFTLRLEPHHAKEATASSDEGDFPLDSAFYKGSFQLKKSGSRYQTVVDNQIVMRYAKNSQGSFNVYGKGTNAIGEFNLTGTLVMSGKTGGQVELYRMYPPDRLAVPPAPAKAPVEKPLVPKFPPPVAEKMVRRESSRAVKLPSKLEDDDPSALLSRVMDKCTAILRTLRERDIALGGHFSEPVDPVALGIPTYLQIIQEPMDLKTINRKMETNAVKSPAEFARLCRLVFQNAITFNVDPSHVVHQAARQLLTLFNQKFRDIERVVTSTHKGGSDGGEEKKKKRREKSLRKRRLEEAQEMAAENSRAISSIFDAAPTAPTQNVTRAEFTAMLQLLQTLSNQIVRTHNIVAELSPGDETEGERVSMPSTTASGSVPKSTSSAPAPAPKKKSTKRKAERIAEEEYVPPMYEDDNTPLTHQEQELLTETINELQPEQLGGVIQIIREAAPVGADEDEIDLEIDQLDTSTQRKLFRHVMKVGVSLDLDLVCGVLRPFSNPLSSLRKRKRRKRPRLHLVSSPESSREVQRAQNRPRRNLLLLNRSLRLGRTAIRIPMMVITIIMVVEIPWQWTSSS